MTAVKLHRYPSPSNGVALGKMGCTDLFHRITAKDYVQSGLVAMWDGIENAGWGTHITSGKWVDLIGGLQSYTTAEFTDNANIAHDGVAGSFEFSNDEKFSRIVNNFTVEVVLVDGGWSNFTYAHALQWLIRDTENGLHTLFQAVVPSADSIIDSRYFLNKPGNINLGSLTPVPGGGYARALAQTFDGTSCKAFRCGVFKDQYDGALTWSPVIGTLQYRLRVYNVSSIFKFHALRLYSRALTANEIARNYAIDKARFGLP